MASLTCLEICAGAGGLALGLEHAGFVHEAAIELDPHACRTLSANRPSWIIIKSDIRSVSGAAFRGIDLFCGGIPSLGRRTYGEWDPLPEVLRLVREVGPRAVLLENGREFATSRFAEHRKWVMERLVELGYETRLSVMHSSDYGVPQLRPRCVLVAIRPPWSRYFQWPSPFPVPPPTVGEILYDLMAERGWPGAGPWRDQALRIAPTIPGGSSQGGPDLGPKRARQAWRALGVDGMGIADKAPGLDFPVGQPPRLTVQMVARLQGFPDDWVFTGGKTAAYRQVSRAFPSPMARVLGDAIHCALDSAVLPRADRTRDDRELSPQDHAWAATGKLGERQVLADRAEADARDALDRRSFDEAAEHLLDAIQQDPDRTKRLQPDVHCLSEQAGDSPARLAWRRGLWLALAASSPLMLAQTHPTYAAPPSTDTAPIPALQVLPKSREKRPVTRSPQQAGTDLELAFIKLLEKFFALAPDDEDKILTRLRRQSSGTQYGHDVQFDCATAANHLVRCHVECKNYGHELKLSDISEKIMQTQAYWERKQIDYFVIVTPRAGISNDLDHYIQATNAAGLLPFQIQVWGPEEGIEEFFAIEPPAYRKVYKTEPPPVDAESVVASWSAKLKPLLRLPTGLRDYLTNPRLHSLVGEDHAHFDALFRDCVEVDAVNAVGSRLGTLREVLSGWIDDPRRRRFLLLGEFGDGKSFACYRLTRSLASAHLDNPAATPFALRLPLCDLISAGSPQELLSRRLQALGADMKDWTRIQDMGPTLIILDGFDEMSAQLDHATVANNLRLLADCVRYFADSKLLVTSRTQFFESSRMQERFLEELGQPEVARVAQLPLTSRIAYLHAFAERGGLSGKFERIRRLYDPIGLAGKPLFLQMIKETLPQLPDDHFDEIVLYETSVRDSLDRKAEMLLDGGMHTLRREAIEGMLELLESVAVELLKNGGKPVDLQAFGKGQLHIARVLWKMSEVDAGPTQTEDARARLGMRSLLKPFPDEGDSGAWPVAFCHRSMCEYFVAQALVRAIRHGDSMAQDLLSTVILRPEIVDFTGLLINKADDAVALARTLAGFARTAVKDARPGYLGGNAITLAYRIRHRPDDPRWARLDLSYADLSGADLTGADFSDTLLCYATLDNADLTDADLTRCDLTGARIEETAPVTSIAPGRHEGSVVACYGDGTIREWELDGSRAIPRTLLDGLSALYCAAWGPYGDLIVIAGSRLSLWTTTADGIARNDAIRIRGGIEYVRFNGDAVSFAQTDEKMRIAVSVDCEGATLAAGLQLTNPGPIALRADQTAVLTADGRHVAVARPDMRDPRPVAAAAADVTALALFDGEPRMVELVVGDSKGQVTASRIPVDGGPRAVGAKATLRLHSGPVLSAAFLSQGLVATGGTDRSLIVCEWNDGQFRALRELKLTLRCSGVKTAGVQGNRERLALEALRDNAEKLPSMSVPRATPLR